MIHDLISVRWSPYSFSPEKIDEKDILQLFEAAGKAPSANNEQPWLFVHVTRENRKTFDAFTGFLADGNQIWAKNAYMLAVSLARMNSSYNGKPNRHAFHDTGMAVASMLFQATSMGLYVHQMAGFSIEKVKDYLDLKEGIEPVAMMAIGHLGDGRDIPENIADRDKVRRGRKILSEYSFSDKLPGQFVRNSG